jgi:hypothetical protein
MLALLLGESCNAKHNKILTILLYLYSLAYLLTNVRFVSPSFLAVHLFPFSLHKELKKWGIIRSLNSAQRDDLDLITME